MIIPLARKIQYPLTDYTLNALGFGVHGIYEGRDWGVHLGEDVLQSHNTPVFSIGTGHVVYSAVHVGSVEKGNWGNIVIIGHKHPVTKKVFYALYGHLGTRTKNTDDKVKKGEVIGTVGKSNTPENGWWEEEHLHFSIYIGPWSDKILPGYYKKEQKRTHLEDWVNPSEFIKKYNSLR